MKKICILSDADSIHTRKWIYFLSQFDYEIHLISMRDTSYVFKENVKKYIVGSPIKSKLGYFMIPSKIKKLVKEINPDVLHSHFASSYGMFGALTKKKPFVVSVWGRDVYEFPKKNVVTKKILENTLKRADVICSTSEDMAKETIKYCNKKLENIVITPFGVDTNLFNIKKEILHNDVITVGVAKNLKPVYGIDLLLKAVKLLKDEREDIKIIIMVAGDGVERRNLEDLSKELEIGEIVNFLGNIDNIKIPEIMNEMDIVCLPSYEESFGVAAVEASSCGRPVLASYVGGLKETVIDGYNGFHFKKGDVKDIKDKLVKLIDDKESMKIMGQNGRKMACSKYDWENNAQIMKKLYDELINS